MTAASAPMSSTQRGPAHIRRQVAPAWFRVTPRAGLVAGLMAALSGPLIIYEHYLMSEALFTLVLTLALLALVVAVRRPTRAWLLVAGGAVALSGLTRPIGQAVVPIGLGLPLLLA